MPKMDANQGPEVLIGNKLIGAGHPSYIVAEIGINHNGDIDLARRLISVAVAAGCDAVKFQKRTVDVVYTPEELAKPRENPFGPTNGDLKRGLEFGLEEYKLIDPYCREVKMPWLASCWVERHVPLGRAMWGSDQAASLEPNGLSRIVSYIRIVEQSLGDGVKRVYERELPIIQKLRRVGSAV